MTAPTPPEPVGDWAAYNAAQMRALHPTPTERTWTPLGIMSLIVTYEREFTPDAKFEHTPEWKYDVGKLVEALKSCNADADALRRLAFEVVFAFDSEELMRLDQKTFMALARIYDEAPDEWLDESERKRPDTLRERLALTKEEAAMVNDVERWVDVGNLDGNQLVAYGDEYLRKLLDIIKRLTNDETRDGGGR